jgi:hypothetical protein
VKLLVDACVAASAKIALARAGHEAESVADWDHDPGDMAISRMPRNISNP